jgi:hypothetical protein
MDNNEQVNLKIYGAMLIINAVCALVQTVISYFALSAEIDGMYGILIVDTVITSMVSMILIFVYIIAFIKRPNWANAIWVVQVVVVILVPLSLLISSTEMYAWGGDYFDKFFVGIILSSLLWLVAAIFLLTYAYLLKKPAIEESEPEIENDSNEDK